MIYYRVKPINEDFYIIQYTGYNKDDIQKFLEHFWPGTYIVNERESYFNELYILWECSRNKVISIYSGEYILRTSNNMLSSIHEKSIDTHYEKLETIRDNK